MVQPTKRRRIIVSVIIGLFFTIACYTRLLYGHCAGGECMAGDFTWSIRGAQHLLNGQNPYHDPSLSVDRPYPYNAPLFYPLPALLVALPFVPLPWEGAGAIFFGISSGILAFSLFRDDFARWPLFMSATFWFALIAVQWSPLVLATALLPTLLPCALVKPNIGIPVFLSYVDFNMFRHKLSPCGNSTKSQNNMNEQKSNGQPQSWLSFIPLFYPPWREALLSLLVLGVSLLILPSWIMDWTHNAIGHTVFVPINVFPGIFILFALWHWQKREARILLLMSLMPQRPVYDQLLLWVVPQSYKQTLIMSLLSWITILGWLMVPAMNVQWVVLGTYLPSLVVMFVANRQTSSSAQRENSYS